MRMTNYKKHPVYEALTICLAMFLINHVTSPVKVSLLSSQMKKQRCDGEE